MRNKRTVFILLISSISLCIFFIPSVRGIVPEVQEVIFSNDGSETILDVTIYHTPVTTSHHVNQIEVDIDGVITSYPVTQTATTFSVSVNLGEITGEPPARVRAFCIVDGWSSWTNQQNIPEFSSWIILSLSLVVILPLILLRRRLRN